MGDSVDNYIPFLSGKVELKSWRMRKDLPECGFTTKPMIVFYSSPLVLGTISTHLNVSSVEESRYKL